MPGEAIGCGETHHPLAAINLLTLALCQPADKAPRTAVVAEQTRTRTGRSPGQHSARLKGIARPAEGVPVGHLVKVVKLLPVNR